MCPREKTNRKITVANNPEICEVQHQSAWFTHELLPLSRIIRLNGKDKEMNEIILYTVDNSLNWYNSLKKPFDNLTQETLLGYWPKETVQNIKNDLCTKMSISKSKKLEATQMLK